MACYAIKSRLSSCWSDSPQSGIASSPFIPPILPTQGPLPVALQQAGIPQRGAARHSDTDAHVPRRIG